jgi:ABC-type antimicrobial peptide transport system permease subunit
VRSYVVSQRTREIGIRMALGAGRGDVLWLVLREGLLLTAVGVGAGLLLSAGAARLLDSLLYEVSTIDPMVFMLAPLVLTGSALLASYLPARRATRVVPMVALRHE